MDIIYQKDDKVLFYNPGIIEGRGVDKLLKGTVDRILLLDSVHHFYMGLILRLRL